MKTKLNWELVDEQKEPAPQWEALLTRRIERASIPGGWLVRAAFTTSMRGNDKDRVHVAASGGITFVPDPDHSWA